jgi:hypothetical protein
MLTTKIKGRSKVILKCDNLRELQRKLEEFAYTFLCSLEVGDEKYYKKSESRRWGKVPCGYFMVSKYDKIIIYKKSIYNGYIYNSTVIDKIISFSIFRPAISLGQLVPLDSILLGINMEAIEIKKKYWVDVHAAIILKGKDKEPSPKITIF